MKIWQVPTLDDHIETIEHARRVVEMTTRMAKRLGFEGDALEHVRIGALLHDVGKIAVPDTILLKRAPLTPSEWAIMRQHPIYGYQMLSTVESLQPALSIPLSHHERWDGNGYPYGLSGEEIPIEARIFTLVDVYDALTHDRPYRAAWTREQALVYIRNQAGLHFDPALVELFVEIAEDGE